MRMDAATESGWTNEGEEAFQRIKRKLRKFQTLTIPKEGEDLMLCLRQRNEMVSSILMVESKGVQTPVSYVNMDDHNITIEEFIMLEEEKARRCAIVFDDAFKSEVMLSCEPTGELYVAMLRVKSKQWLKAFCCDMNDNYTDKITNIVYKKILCRL
ncbi:hypothetical protein Tco_0691201 [Tanacetum coccineum]